MSGDKASWKLFSPKFLIHFFRIEASQTCFAAFSRFHPGGLNVTTLFAMSFARILGFPTSRFFIFAAVGVSGGRRKFFFFFFIHCIHFFASGFKQELFSSIFMVCRKKAMETRIKDDFFQWLARFARWKSFHITVPLNKGWNINYLFWFVNLFSF